MEGIKYRTGLKARRRKPMSDISFTPEQAAPHIANQKNSSLTRYECHRIRSLYGIISIGDAEEPRP